MQKSLFVEAKLDHFKGKRRIDILQNQDKKLISKAKDSILRIANVITFYDFGKVEDTDYYFIFKKFGVNNNFQDEEAVRAITERFVKGETEGVINPEGLTIGTEKESDVFIDVVNNIIITKGENNLQDVCVDLLMHSYDYIKQEWNVDRERAAIERSTDTALIYKTHKLDMHEQIEMTSRKPIKLFYN